MIFFNEKSILKSIKYAYPKLQLVTSGSFGLMLNKLSKFYLIPEAFNKYPLYS